MKDIAIVLTAHPRQQKFWPPVLQCLENYPGPVILAYDDIDTAMIPPAIMMRFADAVVTGYKPGVLGHGPGELLCMKKGFEAAAGLGAEYCLKLGFDDPPYRWRNLTELRRILTAGQLDIIDDQTRAVFGRTAVLTKLMGQADLEVRKGSAESYYKFAAGKIGARRRTYNGEWFELQIGIIHIHGEYALNAGKGPAWTWQIGELWPRKS